MDPSRIRNFCIIAHIDHGKSTLADRILQSVKAIADRDFQDQVLDDMDLERERGITIKAKAVALDYPLDGVTYRLNLIDTPGHVDFAYEVSRSLSACEGAILVVDASQGVEAQTVANVFLAREVGLEIIPVLNKIDLPNSRPEETALELETTLEIPMEEVFEVSAKTGKGLEPIMRAVIEKTKAPEADSAKPLRALIFDSHYDDYRGVVVYLRVIDGKIKPGDKVRAMGTGKVYDVSEVGIFKPNRTPTDTLHAGEVGYLIGSIKAMRDVRVGDTVTHMKTEVEPLPGYQDPKAMVFCSLYPAQEGDYRNLQKALERLHLNDTSFSYEAEKSDTLGFGFRCGFLGLMHMEIVQERLERDNGISLVTTAPSVPYRVIRKDGQEITIERPSELDTSVGIAEVREPVVQARLILPLENVGQIMKLCKEKRGKHISMENLGEDRVILTYDLPLGEILFDFYDQLKSLTRGYGSMDTRFKGYEADDLVKLRILVSGEEVDALSQIVHRDKAERVGRALIERLKDEIPRQMFQIPLQAAIGGKFIARENIPAIRKNVTAKCYGGDISRKRKLLEKQKEGKRRMKSVGRVQIPQEAFLSVMNLSKERGSGGKSGN